MKFRLFILAFLFLLHQGVSAQNRLVSVLREQTLTLDQQIDSVIQEFGIDVKAKDLDNAFRLLQRFGRSVRYVALSYRTVDPLGEPIIATGLLSFPAHGFIHGVVEIPPYSREKAMCGTRRLYTTEGLTSVLGYVALIPDNIGYGGTESLPIAYQICEHSALVSAHLREAAAEYFAQYRKRKLPSKSIIFGYSLGAANALALAYYYTEQPTRKVKVKALCLGSGAYNPSLALEHTLKNGSLNYMIYPGFVRSLNVWCHAGLHLENLFKGQVLDDLI